MDPETIFSLAGAAAMTGWAALALSPLAPRWLLPYGGYVVPLALSGLYAALALWSLPSAEGGFGSLAEVAALFAAPSALLTGWVHYLAFDLLVGGWEVRDARVRGVPHWAVIPCLVLTLMLGPLGLLAYLAARAALSRKETTA